MNADYADFDLIRVHPRKSATGGNSTLIYTGVETHVPPQRSGVGSAGIRLKARLRIGVRTIGIRSNPNTV
jgi:hypothetical protein